MAPAVTTTNWYLPFFLWCLNELDLQQAVMALIRLIQPHRNRLQYPPHGPPVIPINTSIMRRVFQLFGADQWHFSTSPAVQERRSNKWWSRGRRCFRMQCSSSRSSWGVMMAGRRLATRKQASLLRAEETKKETMMGKRGGDLVWEDKLLVGRTTPSSSVFVYCVLGLSLTAFVESEANSYK